MSASLIINAKESPERLRFSISFGDPVAKQILRETGLLGGGVEVARRIARRCGIAEVYLADGDACYFVMFDGSVLRIGDDGVIQAYRTKTTSCNSNPTFSAMISRRF